MTTDLYRFPVLLSKSYETNERGAKTYVMEGIASDESADQQGDAIDQQQMNFQPLLRSGFVNWDHQDGPENLIGHPLEGQITSQNAFFVRNSIYVDDVERAAHAWRLAKAAERGVGRPLGWSVQGAVLERSGRRIIKSEVRHLALTHQPINANTWAAIVKSMNTASAAPIQIEHLDDHITSVLWGDCSDPSHYTTGRNGMLAHLCTCKGIPVEHAASIMKRLVDSTR